MTFDLADLDRSILGTRFADRVHHFASVESTMNLAVAAGAAGAQAGVWIADEQTAGRGRGGHTWHSAPGEGLYVSLLVTPLLPLSFAHRIPLATGLAVRGAVLEATGLTLDLRWPNDLMFADLKCGGILVEATGKPPSEPSIASTYGDQLRYAVIGIGLNLNHAAFPPELAGIATSLYLESGREFTRELILSAILRHADNELRQLRRDFEGHHKQESLFTRFEHASTWVSGKRVRVGEGSDAYLGITRGLTAEGFLRVEDETGTLRTVLSGGVRSA